MFNNGFSSFHEQWLSDNDVHCSGILPFSNTGLVQQASVLAGKFAGRLQDGVAWELGAFLELHGTCSPREIEGAGRVPHLILLMLRSQFLLLLSVLDVAVFDLPLIVIHSFAFHLGHVGIILHKASIEVAERVLIKKLLLDLGQRSLRLAEHVDGGVARSRSLAQHEFGQLRLL